MSISVARSPITRDAPAPPTLSSTAWRRVRRALTAGVFAAATITAVGVGLQGAAVSPVAPAAATAADGVTAPAPLVGDAHGSAADHRLHR